MGLGHHSSSVKWECALLSMFADGTKAGFCVLSDMEKGGNLGRELMPFHFDQTFFQETETK